VPTIRLLRKEAEALRAQTSDQARRMLASGKDPREVIDFLASTLTNRLLHAPSQRLREAAERGDLEVVQAAKALFAPEVEPAENNSADLNESAAIHSLLKEN